MASKENCVAVEVQVTSEKNASKGNAEDKEDDSCGICFCTIVERGRLNCCAHRFCIECILRWAEVESTCPQCKRMFHQLCCLRGVEGGGSEELVYSITVPERKQRPLNEFPDEEEEGDDEDLTMDPQDILWLQHATCCVCETGGDDHLFLICSVCNRAGAHTYCVGLEEVPEDDWFCDACAHGEDWSLEHRLQPVRNEAGSLRSRVTRQQQQQQQQRVRRRQVQRSRPQGRGGGGGGGPPTGPLAVFASGFRQMSGGSSTRGGGRRGVGGGRRGGGAGDVEGGGEERVGDGGEQQSSPPSTSRTLQPRRLTRHWQRLAVAGAAPHRLPHGRRGPMLDRHRSENESPTQQLDHRNDLHRSDPSAESSPRSGGRPGGRERSATARWSAQLEATSDVRALFDALCEAHGDPQPPQPPHPPHPPRPSQPQPPLLDRLRTLTAALPAPTTPGSTSGYWESNASGRRRAEPSPVTTTSSSSASRTIHDAADLAHIWDQLAQCERQRGDTDTNAVSGAGLEAATTDVRPSPSPSSSSASMREERRSAALSTLLNSHGTPRGSAPRRSLHLRPGATHIPPHTARNRLSSPTSPHNHSAITPTPLPRRLARSVQAGQSVRPVLHFPVATPALSRSNSGSRAGPSGRTISPTIRPALQAPTPPAPLTIQPRPSTPGHPASFASSPAAPREHAPDTTAPPPPTEPTPRLPSSPKPTTATGTGNLPNKSRHSQPSDNFQQSSPDNGNRTHSSPDGIPPKEYPTNRPPKRDRHVETVRQEEGLHSQARRSEIEPKLEDKEIAKEEEEEEVCFGLSETQRTSHCEDEEESIVVNLEDRSRAEDGGGSVPNAGMEQNEEEEEEGVVMLKEERCDGGDTDQRLQRFDTSFAPSISSQGHTATKGTGNSSSPWEGCLGVPQGRGFRCRRRGSPSTSPPGSNQPGGGSAGLACSAVASRRVADRSRISSFYRASRSGTLLGVARTNILNAGKMTSKHFPSSETVGKTTTDGSLPIYTGEDVSFSSKHVGNGGGDGGSGSGRPSGKFLSTYEYRDEEWEEDGVQAARGRSHGVDAFDLSVSTMDGEDRGVRMHIQSSGARREGSRERETWCGNGNTARMKGKEVARSQELEFGPEASMSSAEFRDYFDAENDEGCAQRIYQKDELQYEHEKGLVARRRHEKEAVAGKNSGDIREFGQDGQHRSEAGSEGCSKRRRLDSQKAGSSRGCDSEFIGDDKSGRHVRSSNVKHHALNLVKVHLKRLFERKQIDKDQYKTIAQSATRMMVTHLNSERISEEDESFVSYNAVVNAAAAVGVSIL